LLVNSAGIFSPKAFLEQTEAEYDSYLEINRGTFFVTQAAAKNMTARGRGGAIVNVGSMWAHQAVAATPSSAYSMAKAGVHSLTQHLAMELSSAQIRVNAVAPAVVETTIYEAFIEPEKVHETLQVFNAFHPIGRVGTLGTWRKQSSFVVRQSRLGHRRGVERRRRRDGGQKLTE
jgi:NAD(P)-dependent dehydrogenase (short-subunit alcohol dehydrogenase family)